MREWDACLRAGGLALVPLSAAISGYPPIEKVDLNNSLGESLSPLAVLPLLLQLLLHAHTAP